jgi:hypothetical protein
MSAHIRVESGISAGTSYWIDRPVLRIGSDPQCDICLPSADLAPHALTVEFRNNTYRVYNRSGAPITIGRQVVQAGGNELWPADQMAALSGGLNMVLEVDGDSRPSPRPDSITRDNADTSDDVAIDAADSSQGTTAAKKSSSTMIQLGVIAFCLLGMGAFLTMNRGGGATTANRPTFDAIVKESLAASEGSAMRKLLPQLQYAQAAVVRGNAEVARVRFSRLRDRLVSQIDSLSGDSRKQAETALDYVEYQLSRLN